MLRYACLLESMQTHTLLACMHVYMFPTARSPDKCNVTFQLAHAQHNASETPPKILYGDEDQNSPKPNHDNSSSNTA